jgi:hypothetical protein
MSFVITVSVKMSWLYIILFTDVRTGAKRRLMERGNAREAVLCNVHTGSRGQLVGFGRCRRRCHPSAVCSISTCLIQWPTLVSRAKIWKIRTKLSATNHPYPVFLIALDSTYEHAFPRSLLQMCISSLLQFWFRINSGLMFTINFVRHGNYHLISLIP